MKITKKAITAVVILAITAGSAAAAPGPGPGGKHDRPGGTPGITRPGTPGGMPGPFSSSAGSIRKDGGAPRGMGMPPVMHRHDDHWHPGDRNDRMGPPPMPPAAHRHDDHGHPGGRNDRMGPPPRPDDRRGPGYGRSYPYGGNYYPPVVYGGGVPYTAAPYYYDGWYGRDSDSDNTGKIVLGVIGGLVLGGLLSNMMANNAN